MNTKKAKIPFSEFLEIEKKLEIRAGAIIEAERIPKTDKLIKLTVNFGDDSGVKTVVTNLGETYEPEFFVGIKTLFITNLEPATWKGVVSEAMIMPGERLTGDFEFDLYTPGTQLL
jgi:methionyl-tRNA synthetase